MKILTLSSDSSDFYEMLVFRIKLQLLPLLNKMALSKDETKLLVEAAAL
ncbi:hypothetical protein Tco_0614291, partial [Tanacetum coccineum]